MLEPTVWLFQRRDTDDSGQWTHTGTCVTPHARCSVTERAACVEQSRSARARTPDRAVTRRVCCYCSACLTWAWTPTPRRALRQWCVRGDGRTRNVPSVAFGRQPRSPRTRLFQIASMGVQASLEDGTYTYSTPYTPVTPPPQDPAATGGDVSATGGWWASAVVGGVGAAAPRGDDEINHWAWRASRPGPFSSRSMRNMPVGPARPHLRTLASQLRREGRGRHALHARTHNCGFQAVLPVSISSQQARSPTCALRHVTHCQDAG